MNPSGQPFPNQFGGGPGGGQMPPPNDPVREALNVPGILFMVFGGLTVMYALFGLVSSVIQGADTAAQLKPLLDNPDLPPAAKQLLSTMAGPGAKVLNLLNMGLAAFVAFAGFQMRNLKSYGVAIAGSVVMMLPCGSCCCVLTMPIGIWALVTLMKPEIKNAFT